MRGLTFEPIGHLYNLDGRREVSVTGVLKALGLIKLGGIPGPILERARQRGQDVHELLHFWAQDDLNRESVDEGYRGYLDAAAAFCEQRTFRIVLAEQRVASRRHRVCGTIDAIGLLEGQGAIVDWKTGSPDDVSTDLQTAAYEGLAREWAAEGDDPTLTALLALSSFVRIRRLAVKLNADGTYRVEPYSDPTDYSKFLTLAGAYHIAEARGAELTLADVA